MIHKHFFIPMGDATKIPNDAMGTEAENVLAALRPIHGTQAGCVYCGQIRRVWENGTIEIIQRGKYASHLVDDEGTDS